MFGHRLIANRLSGPGILSFVALEDVQVHVHATNEVPFGIEGDIKENVFFGAIKELIVKVTEIVNDNSVQDVGIQYRKCRFSFERLTRQFESPYDFYSHSTCAVDCAIEIQLQFCNCTHHLMPRKSSKVFTFILLILFGNKCFHYLFWLDNIKVCDFHGLICLTNNFGKNCAVPDVNVLENGRETIRKKKL